MTATSRLTRVTLIGPRHRIDLVLPSGEPVGVLLPEIVAMVGYQPSSVPHRYQVSLVNGRTLDPGESLQQAEVADGTLLRIDPSTDAPPAAVVHDVTDEVADDLAERRGRWGPGPRRWTATAVVIGAAVLSGVLVGSALPGVVPTVAGLMVVLAGSTIALMGGRPAGVALILGGAALAMTAVPGRTAEWSLRWVLWTAGVALTMLAISIATRHQQAGVLGAVTLLSLLGLWTGLYGAGLPADRVAAVMAVLSIGLLGLLPRIAMVSSGLTRLDDQQSEDRPVPRPAAQAAVDSAHRGLALACVATAASGLLAGWVLGHAGNAWTVALACLTGIALLLRLRAFPLTIEVTALTGAALGIGVGLLDEWMRRAPGMWWAGAATVVGVAAIAVAVVGYRPRPHLRARARLLADRIESLTVLVLIPVAVGVFDVYPRLLHTF
jgi:type VII secretion integral membrane protein EccD